MPVFSVEVVQPPTGVTLVSTGRSTARVTWNAVSKVLLYQVAVTDSDPRKTPVVRNTSATSMDISNLEPCSSYTVGVSSVNVFLVPGEPHNVALSTSSESWNSTVDGIRNKSVIKTLFGGGDTAYICFLEPPFSYKVRDDRLR